MGAQLGRIELDAHSGQRAAADSHVAHALDLGDLLCEDRRGGVIDLGAGQRVRGESEENDRGVGRVEFAIGGVAGQAGGQEAAGGVDRGLHVARGAVDVAVRSNCSVTCVEPCELVDVISVMPAIGPSAAPAASPRSPPSSPGWRRASLADTKIVGKSTCGRGETGRNRKATAPVRPCRSSSASWPPAGG